MKDLEGQVEAKSSKKKAKAIKKTQELLNKINEVVKTELWKTVKFISDTQDQTAAAKFVFKNMGYSGEEFVQMVEEFGVNVRQLLFKHQNYCFSEIKKVSWRRIKNTGQGLPKVADIAKCVF